MTNVIRNDVMLNTSSADLHSNQMGPAAYKPDANIIKDTDPRVVWGKSRSVRFQSSRDENAPVPKYFTAEKYSHGPKLAPKPNDLAVQDFYRYRREDEDSLKYQQQMKHEEVMLQQINDGTAPFDPDAVIPKAIRKTKEKSSFQQRLPPTMFIGKKFGVVGRESPGPAYDVPSSSFAKLSKSQYIPFPREFTV
jgi:hypothetical protein